MATTFFSLPSNILSNIYEFDSTFRDKFKEKINNELWSKSFDTFRNNFIKNPIFDNEPIVSRKLNVLLEHLFQLFQYDDNDNKSYFTGLVPDQLNIYTSWKEMEYHNHTIFTDEHYNNNDVLFVSINSGNLFGHSSQFGKMFEGIIYTTAQYNELELKSIIHHNIVLQHDEFIIVSTNYDDDYYHDDHEHSDYDYDYANDDDL